MFMFVDKKTYETFYVLRVNKHMNAWKPIVRMNTSTDSENNETHWADPRLVISLTALPESVAHLRETLDSLRKQTVAADAIELNLPYRSVGGLGDYDDLPAKDSSGIASERLRLSPHWFLHISTPTASQLCSNQCGIRDCHASSRLRSRQGDGPNGLRNDRGSFSGCRSCLVFRMVSRFARPPWAVGNQGLLWHGNP